MTSSRLTYTDRGFLRRAQSQLASAKGELLSLFREGSGVERAKVMAQHRDQETERMFRSSIDTYDGVDPTLQQQGGEGATRLLSEATRRQILRRNMGKDPGLLGSTMPHVAASPTAQHAAGRQRTTSGGGGGGGGGSPMLSKRSLGGAGGASLSAVHRSAPEMASPKHTDFLRRKTGSSASGKHADAPGGPGGSSTHSPSAVRKASHKRAANSGTFSTSSSVSSSGTFVIADGDAGSDPRLFPFMPSSLLPRVSVTQSADQLLLGMAAAVEAEITAAEAAAAAATAGGGDGSLVPAYGLYKGPSDSPAVAGGRSKIPLPTGSSPPGVDVAADPDDGTGGRRHTYTLEDPPELRDTGMQERTDSVFMG